MPQHWWRLNNPGFCCNNEPTQIDGVISAFIQAINSTFSDSRRVLSSLFSFISLVRVMNDLCKGVTIQYILSFVSFIVVIYIQTLIVLQKAGKNCNSVTAD